MVKQQDSALFAPKILETEKELHGLIRMCCTWQSPSAFSLHTFKGDYSAPYCHSECNEESVPSPPVPWLREILRLRRASLRMTTQRIVTLRRPGALRAIKALSRY